MAEKEAVTNKGLTPDWFMRGALAKIGDKLDRFTGRHWQPSSSLATSQLIEKLRTLLDAEKKDGPGKGFVVPHNIKLKMQWDKFSADDDNISLQKLENELLIAAADHINDNLYYTYAPLHIEVKPDYFTEGVKLLVSFDDFADDDPETEMNVTMPLVKAAPVEQAAAPATQRKLQASFSLVGKPTQRTVDIPSDGRLTVGRTGSNGLMIDDNSISKVHASIAIDAANNLSVADTGSTNGTFINGERIAYGKAMPFTVSDSVAFGSVEVRFSLMVPEPPHEEVNEAAPDNSSTEIDGLEFRSRTADSSTQVGPTTTPPVSESQIETQVIGLSSETTDLPRGDAVPDADTEKPAE
jgi:pSer/pThr/pTyr-binding forkhead associated (FHA) protein